MRRGLWVLAAVLVVACGVAVPDRASVPPVSRVIVPPRQPQGLPAGPVGAGALVYRACREGCPTFLLTTYGTQYLLGERTINPPGNFTLSPDGRWLGTPTTGGGYEVRDLQGTSIHTMRPPVSGDAESAYSPWAWSADSQRLVLGYHASGDVSAYTDVDLRTGRSAEFDLPREQEPVGILPSGNLLLLEQSRVQLSSAGRTFTLTSGAGVLADADHGLSIQVSGERIFALAYSGDRITVVEFDSTGKEVARTPLPADEFPLGPVSGGFAIVQVPLDQARGRQRLETLSPSGRQLLFEVPGTADVVLPGAARH